MFRVAVPHATAGIKEAPFGISDLHMIVEFVSFHNR